MNGRKAFGFNCYSVCFTGRSSGSLFCTLTWNRVGEYDVVKSAVLHAYELVPEAYRQKNLNLTKVMKYSC